MLGGRQYRYAQGPREFLGGCNRCEVRRTESQKDATVRDSGNASSARVSRREC